MRPIQRFLFIASLPESLLNFRGELISELISTGIEVHAVAPNAFVASSARERLERMGVVVHSISLDRTGINLIRDVASFLQLCRVMRSVQPHYVLAYTIKPVIYGLLAARLMGVNRRYALITGLGYAFTGTTLPRRGLQRLLKGLYRLVLHEAAAVFFQNADDQQLFVTLNIVPAVRTHVTAGSGVDLQKFSASEAPRDPPVFLLIARLLIDKGIREFVAAARAVKHEAPGARFLLVGPYDSNPAGLIPEEVLAWQTEGVIEYLGEVADVRQVLASCSVYVLPSYREGMPRTVLEAMATGRAIITTDAPGCRETVIEGENGYRVPVADGNAVAAAMRKFVREPKLIASMGCRSRELAEERFDVRAVNSQMLAVMGLSR